MDIEDDIMLHDENDVPSISDIMSDCQYENNFHLTQLMDNCDWLYNTNSFSPKYTADEIKTIEEEGYDEESTDSAVSIREQPPISLFKETKCQQWPWSKSVAATGNYILSNCICNIKSTYCIKSTFILCLYLYCVYIPDDKIPRMTYQEELYLLQRIKKTDLSKAPPAVKRLYRKLAVRKIKREYQLPLLDIDHFGSKLRSSAILAKDSGRVLDRFFNDDLEYVFEQRLQGHYEPTSVHSPYTNRLLKPFIRRDTSCQPLWLRIMEELLAKTNRNNPQWKSPPPRASIDYSYIRPQHIPAINSLCRQFFWPDIDCK